MSPHIVSIDLYVFFIEYWYSGPEGFQLMKQEGKFRILSLDLISAIGLKIHSIKPRRRCASFNYFINDFTGISAILNLKAWIEVLLGVGRRCRFLQGALVESRKEGMSTTILVSTIWNISRT